MTDALHDDRLTLAGLMLESFTGLRGELERRLEEECGLSLISFELLLRLARSPGGRLRMSELAVQTGLSPSGLSRAVDRLEEAELVNRAACPSDRRGAFADLTAEGKRRLRSAVPFHLEHLEENFTGLLSERERRQLEAILRKVRDRVNPGAASLPGHSGL
jgi:MarR family transcriptional regulator, 2-MHQ and catechol-resistance regulon repressor